MAGPCEHGNELLVSIKWTNYSGPDIRGREHGGCLGLLQNRNKVKKFY
jgi:hypothetical protein